MKKLITITLIMLAAAASFAAQQYYNFPLTNTLRDDAQVLPVNVHNEITKKELSKWQKQHC